MTVNPKQDNYVLIVTLHLQWKLILQNISKADTVCMYVGTNKRMISRTDIE